MALGSNQIKENPPGNLLYLQFIVLYDGYDISGKKNLFQSWKTFCYYICKGHFVLLIN